jgi:hypothetical protein
VYLTNGGHIENLGLYELLRRRCKLIIAIDRGRSEHVVWLAGDAGALCAHRLQPSYRSSLGRAVRHQPGYFRRDSQERRPAPPPRRRTGRTAPSARSTIPARRERRTTPTAPVSCSTSNHRSRATKTTTWSITSGATPPSRTRRRWISCSPRNSSKPIATSDFTP